MGEGAWGGLRIYGTPTPLSPSSSNEDRRNIDAESEHEGSELPKRSGSPRKQFSTNILHLSLVREKKNTKIFYLSASKLPSHQHLPYASTLYKFGDYAEQNLGWRDAMASDSQLPSPRDSEYQAFSSSPPLLGFTSNFIQNLSRQKQSDQKKRPCRVPQHMEQPKGTPGQTNTMTIQFSSKNRFPIHELDGPP